MRYVKAAGKLGYTSLHWLWAICTLIVVTRKLRRIVYAGAAGYGLWRYINLAAVVAIALYALMPVPARAQTNTPTPTFTAGPTPTSLATLTPMSGTPSPTPIPGDPSLSTIMWYCAGDGAYYCTWGDYWVTNSILSGNGGEGSKNGNTERFWIPPPNTKRVRMACSYYGFYRAYRHTTASGFAMDWFVQYHKPSLVSMHFVAPGGGGTTPISELELELELEVPPRWQTNDGFLEENRTVDFVLNDGQTQWPNSASFVPGAPGSPNSYIGVSFDHSVSVSGNPSSYLWGQQAGACEIEEVERLDGSTWVPENPFATPVPTVEPTPTACYIGECYEWPAPPSWVPITDSPYIPVIDISDPITVTCTEVLPGYNFDWASEDYSWDSVTVCPEERSISLEMFGMNVGAYIMSAGVLAGVAVLISIIKRA